MVVGGLLCARSPTWLGKLGSVSESSGNLSKVIELVRESPVPSNIMLLLPKGRGRRRERKRKVRVSKYRDKAPSGTSTNSFRGMGLGPLIPAPQSWHVGQDPAHSGDSVKVFWLMPLLQTTYLNASLHSNLTAAFRASPCCPPILEMRKQS